MKSRKSTIHDVAEQLGITASTVSRALSGNDRISQKTKEKVLKVAAELNYQPNRLASNLRTGRGNSIGVVVPRINRNFFSNVISGIESVTNPAGYNIMICQTNEEHENEVRSLQTLINNQVDGIIMSVSANTMNTSHIQKALDESIHIVQFDRVSNELDISKVVNDNLMGGYEVTRHLIEQGYKRIYHFAGPMHLGVYHDRYLGYMKAMNEAGMKVSSDMVFADILTRMQGLETTQTLYKSGMLPDAIFAASDFSALGVLTALKEFGISFPKEIGVAGFANEPFTELTDPGLTTVEQFSERMGQEAAYLLIAEIEGLKEDIEHQTINIKPELIIRQSTYEN